MVTAAISVMSDVGRNDQAGRLTIEEAANMLGVSVDTAKRDSRMAGAWLLGEPYAEARFGGFVKRGVGSTSTHGREHAGDECFQIRAR